MKHVLNYFKSRLKRNIITHSITGFSISSLILFIVHSTEFVQHNTIAAVAMFFLIAILPLLGDFIGFLIDFSNPIYKKLNDFNNIVLKLNEGKNQYRIRSAMTRIDKEIHIIGQMNTNEFHLPALQNFEYIREVMRKILLSVMSTGDKYITISNLDFWVVKPRKPMAFFLNNLEALKQLKTIDRLIILDKQLLNENSIDEGIIKKRESLKELLQEFNAVLDEEKETRFSKIKTLFYFDEDYDKHLKFLLSAIIISNDFKHTMFVKIENWSDLELKNPKIQIKYYDNKAFKINQDHTHDIPKILDALYEHLSIQLEDKKNLEYGEIVDYLKFYKDNFSRLDEIYGTHGERIKALDFALNNMTFFNLEMILKYFKLN